MSYPSGHSLVEIKFDRSKQGCDQDPYWHCSGIWMVSKGAEPPQALAEFVNDQGDWSADLTLLAVSDFDGNGRTEFVFWLDAYNENGFVLYFADFSRHAVFSYGYH